MLREEVTIEDLRNLTNTKGLRMKINAIYQVTHFCGNSKINSLLIGVYNNVNVSIYEQIACELNKLRCKEKSRFYKEIFSILITYYRATVGEFNSNNTSTTKFGHLSAFAFVTCNHLQEALSYDNQIPGDGIEHRTADRITKIVTDSDGFVLSYEVR